MARKMGWIVGIVLGIAIGFWAIQTPGCETIMPDLAEARSIAEDARTAAVEARAIAEQSSDPAALELAKAAEQKAENAVQAVTKVEAAAAEWTANVESGEVDTTAVQDVFSTIGGLIGGERGTVIGTILGGVVGGWWYRRLARQIVSGLQEAANKSPGLKSALAAAKADIHANTPDSVLRFVAKSRIQ